MQIMKAGATRSFSPSPSVKIVEYDTEDPALSFAVAFLAGRYPEKGFALNRQVKELAYVAAGEGKLLRRERDVDLSAGDVVVIDVNEPFAWEGSMTLHLSTAPRFDPQQYDYVD